MQQPAQLHAYAYKEINIIRQKTRDHLLTRWSLFDGMKKCHKMPCGINVKKTKITENRIFC